MKRLIWGAVLAVAASGTALAECEYQGQTYPVGEQVCAAGGWLQECTAAGYWRAIGSCRAADAADPTRFTLASEPEPGATPPPEPGTENSAD